MFLMMSKPVPGWPGYRVTSCGQVWSFKQGRKWKRLKSRWNGRRRSALCVDLSRGSGESREQHNFNVAHVMWIAWNGPVPEGLTVDHRDQDPTHNRLVNLRTSDQSQQNMNRRPFGGTSKFIGVYWHKVSGKWMARIGANGRQKFLGLFVDETMAAIVRDHAAIHRDPVFASLNFPGISEQFVPAVNRGGSSG